MSRDGNPRVRKHGKVHPHAAEILTARMNELGVDTAELAKRANLEEDIVKDIIHKRRIMSARYSSNLGVALDMGKQRLYKAHVSWMESGGT